MSVASPAARHDAIVIGAGIVGAACADALAREGMRVLVLDARYPAGGSTAAGMGHLVGMGDSPQQPAPTTLPPALRRELAPELPAAVEYDPCGTIWVAADEEQLDAVHVKHRLYAQRGIASDVLDARELARLEPKLRSG